MADDADQKDMHCTTDDACTIDSDRATKREAQVVFL
jgi:hypothetical protein